MTERNDASILNIRVNFLANEISSISETNLVFVKDIQLYIMFFVLHALIELYFTFGKKLFCTFIDFRKALIQFLDLVFGKS